jgi:chromosome partition protein MukB
MRAGAEQLGKLRADVQNRSNTLNDISGKLRHAAQEMEQAAAHWGKYYPGDNPGALHGDWNEAKRAEARQAWAEARVALTGQLELVCREYGQELAMPRDREPDLLVGDVLTMLLPPDVELDREEEKLKAPRVCGGDPQQCGRRYPRPDAQAAKDQRHPLQLGLWQGSQGVSGESA